MFEEKKDASDLGFPEIVTGIYITNKKGEILLIRSPKWQNKLVVCGGHVDLNEKVADAVIREAKEETGLDVANPELITVVEMINSPDFSKPNRHFIGLQYKVEIANEEQTPTLDNEEATGYFWLKPEEIVKREDVHEFTIKVVADFLLKPKKSVFGAKKCKDCEKIKKESEEYKGGWQRALADYKNLQKETATRMGEWAQMSERQILEEFIPVYDNFKKAFAYSPLPEGRTKEGREPLSAEAEGATRGWENWQKGIGYIMKQFADILKAHKIEEIKTVGEKFDTNIHEAVGEESAEGKEAGTIIREMDGGYKMGDRVIKPAKVITAK